MIEEHGLFLDQATLFLWAVCSFWWNRCFSSNFWTCLLGLCLKFAARNLWDRYLEANCYNNRFIVFIFSSQWLRGGLFKYLLLLFKQSAQPLAHSVMKWHSTLFDLRVCNSTLLCLFVFVSFRLLQYIIRCDVTFLRLESDVEFGSYLGSRIWKYFESGLCWLIKNYLATPWQPSATIK